MVEADRRPIASRNTTWARSFAAGLARKGITPNAISQLSIAFGALGGAALVGTRFVQQPLLRSVLFVVAAISVQLRLACNLFDGMVAIEGGKKTPTGEVWNELPDRVSDTFLLVGAGCAFDLVWGTLLGVSAALFAMATAYVRLLGAVAGIGHDFAGPMAKQHRMALLTLACLLCAALVPLGYERQVLGSVLALIAVGSLFTAVRRTWRVLRKLE
jgi:phosphatidylglycerophosphate synthase